MLVLSLLVGVGLVALVTTAKPGQNYLIPTSSKPDYRVVCCWPTNDGAVLVSAGSSHITWVTVDSLNSFVGAVSLNVDLDLPVVISPSMVTLAPRGELQSAQLTILAPAQTPSGIYVGTVAATSGSTIRTAAIEVSVGPQEPDFRITVNPASLAVSPSTTGTSRVSVESLNGFEGMVSLSTTGTPAGFALSLEGFNVTLTAGGTDEAVLAVYMLTDTVSTDFDIVVTGTGGSKSHQVVVSVDATVSSIPDFRMIAVPLLLDVTAGSFISSSIQLTSINGFAGDISLNARVYPSIPNGPQASLSATTVSLTSGGSATSTLTISTTSNTPPQSYNFTVTGISGSVTHEVWGSVMVSSSTEAPSFTMTAGPNSDTMPQGQPEIAAVAVTRVKSL